MKYRLTKRKREPSSDDAHHHCHHEINYLIMFERVFWCTETNINGKDWKMRAQGCVCCEGMFLVEG